MIEVDYFNQQNIKRSQLKLTKLQQFLSFSYVFREKSESVLFSQIIRYTCMLLHGVIVTE